MMETNGTSNTPESGTSHGIAAQAMSEAGRFEQLKTDLKVIYSLIDTSATTAEAAGAIRAAFSPHTTERHTGEIMGRIFESIDQGLWALRDALNAEPHQYRETRRDR